MPLLISSCQNADIARRDVVRWEHSVGKVGGCCSHSWELLLMKLQRERRVQSHHTLAVHQCLPMYVPLVRSRLPLNVVCVQHQPTAPSSSHPASPSPPPFTHTLHALQDQSLQSGGCQASRSHIRRRQQAEALLDSQAHVLSLLCSTSDSLN